MSLEDICNFLGFKEMRNFRHVLRQLLSEFIGSFLYLSLVLSAGITVKEKEIDGRSGTVLVAIANGGVIASVITIFGHVSGGHINPAVTIGSFVCKQIKLVKALCYVLMQVVGAIAGSAVAYALSSEDIRGHLGATIPYHHLRADQILGLEFLMTFVLVAVVLSVVDTTRGARGLGSAPLAIGISITAGICACSPYTACLNPVRSLGPAVVMGIWKDHWVYWAGPLAGGLAAGLVYRFLLFYHHHTIILSSSRPDLHRTQDIVGHH